MSDADLEEVRYSTPRSRMFDNWLGHQIRKGRLAQLQQQQQGGASSGVGGEDQQK